VIEGEVARSVKKGYLPEQFSDNAKRMITQLFDKYLHMPTKNLRELAKQNDGQAAVNAFKKVFEIETDDSNPIRYKTKQSQRPSPEMMKRLKGEQR
jgi:glutamyl-tRNA reductase